MSIRIRGVSHDTLRNPFSSSFVFVLWIGKRCFVPCQGTVKFYTLNVAVVSIVIYIVCLSARSYLWIPSFTMLMVTWDGHKNILLPGEIWVASHRNWQSLICSNSSGNDENEIILSCTAKYLDITNVFRFYRALLQSLFYVYSKWLYITLVYYKYSHYLCKSLHR